MLTTPTFESNSSFQESSGADEDLMDDFDSHSGDWGVVSNTDSEINEDLYSEVNNEFIGSGVLILDGVESSTYEPSVFSIPYSLPTEIGTLEDEGPQIDIESHKAIVKRKFLLLLVPVLGAGLVALGFHYRERNAWRSSEQRLAEEIRRLELENERIKLSQQPPEWDDPPENDEPGDFTFLDNCWVKAKANVKLGDCGDETKDGLRDFAKNARKQWESFWNGTSTLDTVAMAGAAGAMGHALRKAAEAFHEENPPGGTGRDRSKDIPSFPLAVGEAISETSKKFTEKITELFGSLDGIGEDDADPDGKVRVSQASEALAEAMVAAGEIVTVEMKELSEDPFSYFTSVVKGASHTAEPERVTMKGIFEATSAISTASKTFGEALVGTTGELVSAIMDDPLSIFEYEPEN